MGTPYMSVAGRKEAGDRGRTSNGIPFLSNTDTVTTNSPNSYQIIKKKKYFTKYLYMIGGLMYNLNHPDYTRRDMMLICLILVM